MICNLIDLTISFSGYRRYFYAAVTIFEFFLFSAFIYHILFNPRFKKIIIVSGVAFGLFILAYTPFAKFVRIDSVPIGIETILILVFSFYYLYEQLNNTKILFIYNQYQFWVITGFMIYLSGSFFVYIFANQMPYEEVVKYWFIIDIFLILKNLFFTIAILTFARQANNRRNSPIHTFKATH